MLPYTVTLLELRFDNADKNVVLPDPDCPITAQNPFKICPFKLLIKYVLVFFDKTLKLAHDNIICFVSVFIGTDVSSIVVYRIFSIYCITYIF